MQKKSKKHEKKQIKLITKPFFKILTKLKKINISKIKSKHFYTKQN